MTATYKMKTKQQQIAKDIVRAAKELNLTLWFRCNKQLHQVEFQLETDAYGINQMNALLKAYRSARATPRRGKCAARRAPGRGQSPRAP